METDRGPGGARIISEISLEELTDKHPDGHHVSHFELYLEAMDKAGADQKPILHFLNQLENGKSWPKALDTIHPKRKKNLFAPQKKIPLAPAQALEFTRSTLEICEGPLNRRIAAFTLGRETVLPQLFQKTLHLLTTVPADLQAEDPCDLSMLKYYLDRHIELDGDSHGPLCADLFNRYCMKDAATRSDTFYTLCEVLDQRIALWDAVEEKMAENRSHLNVVPDAPQPAASVTKLTSSQGE